MWWLVYLGLIGAMVVPMIGVAFGLRCYKGCRIRQGKASVIICVVISLVLAAISVYLVTVLLEMDKTETVLIWVGIFGYLLLTSVVYIRMMFFSKWAKRRMGILGKGREAGRPVSRVMTVEDVGKDIEKRLAQQHRGEEE